MQLDTRAECPMSNVTGEMILLLTDQLPRRRLCLRRLGLGQEKSFGVKPRDEFESEQSAYSARWGILGVQGCST